MLRKLSLTDRYARETTLRSLLAGNQVGGVGVGVGVGGGVTMVYRATCLPSHRYAQYTTVPRVRSAQC